MRHVREAEAAVAIGIDRCAAGKWAARMTMPCAMSGFRRRHRRSDRLMLDHVAESIRPEPEQDQQRSLPRTRTSSAEQDAEDHGEREGRDDLAAEQ